MRRVNSWASSFALRLLIAGLAGCGGGDDGFDGASASLAWDPVNHQTPIYYTVHYGTQSSGDDGSCNYENSVDVFEPSALVTGLQFDTQYYFAVSAHLEHGPHSQCSNEVSKVTTAQTPV